MINNLKYVDLEQISLDAAIACNLQCKYCQISELSKSTNIADLIKNTNQALLDGTYLNNCKKILKRLKQKPGQIKKIEIWGQEPTLILPYFTKNFKEWYDYFYNIERIMFSTNAMTPNFVDIIYEYIMEIVQHTNSQITLEIQVSYDGLFGEEDVRGGNRETILQNLLELNEKLNQTFLDNVNVFIFFHGVLSLELMSKLDSFYNIDLFFQDISNFTKKIYNSSFNKNVRYGPYTLQCQNSTINSIEDGLLLQSCCERIHKVISINHYEYFDFFPYLGDFKVSLIGNLAQCIADNMSINGYDTIQEYASDFFMNPSMQCIEKEITGYCGSFTHDLKILYDGTVLSCQNYMFDSFKTKDQFKNTIEDQINYYSVNEGPHSLNFLTASDEEIDKILYFAHTLSNNNLIGSQTHILANLMFQMASCDLIDGSYKNNLRKIETHAFILSHLNSCYYALNSATGSSIMHGISDIKLLCNGIMDLIENEINILAKRFRNGEMEPSDG